MRNCLVLLLITLLLVPVHPVRAQDQSPDQPVYVVQSGDTLSSIAIRFGLSLDQLIQSNPSVDPNNLRIGENLVIPGLEGIRGTLQTEAVNFGDTLASLSRRFQISEDMLVRLNHLTSPAELYVGANFIIPQSEQVTANRKMTSLSPGQSLLELAVLNGTDPWTLIGSNALSSSSEASPNEPFFVSSASGGEELTSPIHPSITRLDFLPLPLIQGKTEVLKIQTREPLLFSGSLGDYELHFFSETSGEYIALQGIHALAEPGLVPFSLRGETADGAAFEFTQMVPIELGGYINDLPLTVPPETIDPEVTAPENELWSTVVEPATPQKYWMGAFELPSHLFTREYCLDTAECWSSRFGSRRSYNGSAYSYFHSGLDIYGGTGIEIFAPAAGIVVFANTLTVRGGATIIDHGWGVYSAYMHQSEIKVQVGDHVEPGQLIGLIGATGRVQGPHLHWEVLVGGVQVDPLDWLSTSYP